MDFIEAIDKRISCRAYTGQAVEPQKEQALWEAIEEINAETGLHFQLYSPREDGSAIDMNRQMFAGKVPMYAALVGPCDPISLEKLGYYGERFVLLTTTLGLGTCWVAGTYKKETTRAKVLEGEALHDVIPLGYAPAKMPLKQTAIRATIRRRDKKFSALFDGTTDYGKAPAWIRAGVEAAHKAPTAVNQQSYVFTQTQPNGPVYATLPNFKNELEYTDLGIVKLHFELGAQSEGVKGIWQWGVGGAFEI